MQQTESDQPEPAQAVFNGVRVYHGPGSLDPNATKDEADMAEDEKLLLSSDSTTPASTGVGA